jgi:hypothetical protein
VACGKLAIARKDLFCATRRQPEVAPTLTFFRVSPRKHATRRAALRAAVSFGASPLLFWRSSNGSDEYSLAHPKVASATSRRFASGMSEDVR